MSNHNQTPCNSIFKFLDRKHVPHLLSGLIRLGSLQKYRMLEILSGDSWIGDRREGLATTLIEQNSYRTPTGGTVFERMNRYVSYVDGWVLCLSYGSLNSLSQAMTETPSTYTYDACVQIKDLSTFISRLSSAKFSGGIVGNMFKIYTNICTYETTPETHIGTGDGIIEANPFLKEKIYERQSEYRILLAPKEPVRKQDDITIDLGDCTDIMEEQPLAVYAPRSPNVFLMDECSALAALHSVVQRWYVCFPDSSRANMEEMAELHTELKPIIGEAYGSMRFCHEQSDSFVDQMLWVGHWTPEPIYKAIKLYLSDRGIN